jgi:hypothetical protein
MKNKSESLRVDCSKDFNLIDINIKENSFIRIFDQSIHSDEFVWHKDKNKRIVRVLCSDESWQFQYDNKLPFFLKNDDVLTIEKESYHKLHKGNGTLVLHIKEEKNNIFNARLGEDIKMSEIKNARIISGTYVFTYRGTVWSVDKKTFLKNVK